MVKIVSQHVQKTSGDTAYSIIANTFINTFENRVLFILLIVSHIGIRSYPIKKTKTRMWQVMLDP
ncbi:hypothetical protein R50912_14395 [Paenibacillus sp. FSL R5-0912]|nr:hypothetical protein R50912_14395 [Paenibacillus sp. FSL R5-0912]